MRGRRHKLQVSTFPFLAVLLCAMGSLILVLLVMDRKAHRAAQARAQREAVRLAEERARGAAEQQAERQRLEQQARTAWEQKRDGLHEKLTREQVEMQLQMRKVREQLQEIAARLHYEQDTSTDLRRKVQGERERLQAEEQLLRTLRSRSEQTGQQSKESSQALRRMTLDLLQMEQALKDLNASRQREQKTFSVVPYHGRRGESRRPIYVECTADAVIFHPEHKAIPLTALLPGAADPSAAVRAEVAQRVARQHAKLAALPNNGEQNPYLLLLVRPTGVNTYNYLYHSALKDLQVNDKEVQVDFGYEFIDDDWVLDFPADDEQPNTQPWMIATKSSSPSPSVRATSPPPSSSRMNDRPIALAPGGDLGGSPGGIRGFRASETGGTGNWVRGLQSNGSRTGTRPGMQGGNPGGIGISMPGGNGGSVEVSSSVRGWSEVGGGGGGGTGGSGSPGVGVVGQSSGASRQSSNATSPFIQSSPLSQGGFEGSGSLPSPPGGGRGVGGEGGGYVAGVTRGSGRGHPAALLPSFHEGGGGGFSYDGGPPPNGLTGSGAFSLRPSSAASGYGSSMQGSPGLAGSGGPGGSISSAPGGGMVGLQGGGSGSPGVAGVGAPGLGGSALSGGGGSGSPGGGGSDLPGLGPPRALPSSPQGGYASGGTGQSPSVGTGTAGSGVPGNGILGGSPAGSGIPGTAGATGPPADRRYPIAQGNTSGSGSGQTPYLGGGGTGTGNSAPPGGPGSGTSPPGTQFNNGAGTSMQGSANSSPGMQAVNGGSGGSQAPGGTPANSGRPSDVVVYVDPLTGKPTSAPRPTTPQPDGSAEESSQTDGQPRPPRVRVVTAGSSGGGRGGVADPQGEAMNRFAPTPTMTPARHKPVVSHPVWVHGGRDWTIYVECRADSLVLYPSQRAYPLAQVMSDPAGNPLAKTIQQMIDRRQALRRPGEPPYRPQVCLLVRPEYNRTFLSVYPALEALPVPKTRRNLDADDDVIDIVNGASQ